MLNRSFSHGSGKLFAAIPQASKTSRRVCAWFSVPAMSQNLRLSPGEKGFPQVKVNGAEMNIFSKLLKGHGNHDDMLCAAKFIG